jgi:hypothetical protein
MISQVHKTPWMLNLNIFTHYIKKPKVIMISHHIKALMVSIILKICSNQINFNGHLVYVSLITSCKLVESSKCYGQWQCIHILWLYKSMFYTNCKVVLDWTLHFC